MWNSVFLFIIFTITVSSGCLCSDDGTAIECYDDDNVPESELLNICVSSNDVLSVSIGYSIFCYRTIRKLFPNLKNIYIGGGDGSSCECYDQMKCIVVVANCNCVKPSTEHSTTSTGVSTTSAEVSTNSGFIPTSSVAPTIPSNEMRFGGIVAIFIALMLVMVVIFVAIIFIGYKYCYLKLRYEMQSYRDHLVGNDPQLDDIEAASGGDDPELSDGGHSTAGISPPADAAVVSSVNNDSVGENDVDLKNADRSPIVGLGHCATPFRGVVNNGYSSTPESALKLVDVREKSCRYKKMASGPTTVQGAGRLLFPANDEQTQNDAVKYEHIDNDE